MFNDEKSKDIEEHTFNFGDQDVEKFQQRIQGKLDSKSSSKQENEENSDEEIDFIN